MIENVVIVDSDWIESDIYLLFGDEYVHFTYTIDLPSLLKELGIYKSTSEARKAGRIGDVPKGWSEIKASKKRRLWVWNPDDDI